ncbi:sulfite exporter TauE/SafE family protein [Ekhidna sp. MALMAid0563]|uniref:sulfite exporter TauE/SafE family protein n=1 Tax=Ekhidna sp. MALMAid0563 TaxID=3143937 RepID=UPI0032DF4CD0
MIGAFIIGLFGSLHCAGMCGPVMMAFMGPNQSKKGFAFYHSGRILAYVLIGGILGLLGATIVLIQLQKFLVFFLGFGLILLYSVPSIRHRLERFYFESSFYQFLKSFISKNLSTKRRWFLSGVANGFFPCGLTYVAAAGAVALGNPFAGVLFMVLFGLGTLPALISLSFVGNVFSGRMKSFIPRSIPIIAITSGLLLIIRGLLTTFPQFNQLVQANAAGLITVCGL